MSFLAQNPACQERARQEAVGALGTKGYLDFKDAGQLPYITACLRETLRLYSAVAAFQRECVKETVIKASDGKKYKFHAGQKVSTRARAHKHAFLQH